MLGMISLFTLHSEVPPIRRVAGPAHLLLRSERAEETLTNKHVLIILEWSSSKGEGDDHRSTNLISKFVVQFPVKLCSSRTKSEGNMELF